MRAPTRPWSMRTVASDLRQSGRGAFVKPLRRCWVRAIIRSTSITFFTERARAERWASSSRASTLEGPGRPRTCSLGPVHTLPRHLASLTSTRAPTNSRACAQCWYVACCVARCTGRFGRLTRKWCAIRASPSGTMVCWVTARRASAHIGSLSSSGRSRYTRSTWCFTTASIDRKPSRIHKPCVCRGGPQAAPMTTQGRVYQYNI
mmetsp:Transcript_14736/g.39162  ORF Transcript_14736/g.39162 Transcript_14736/m.39162 type:complete len:205 (-) Transcript_14736:1-615(-)